MSSQRKTFSSLSVESVEANHSPDYDKNHISKYDIKTITIIATQNTDPTQRCFRVSRSGVGSYQLGGRSKVGPAISVTTELRIVPPLTSLLHVIKSLKQRSYLSGRRVRQLSL